MHSKYQSMASNNQLETIVEIYHYLLCTVPDIVRTAQGCVSSREDQMRFPVYLLRESKTAGPYIPTSTECFVITGVILESI